MNLIKCPDCEKMISPRAAQCPECGCPSEYFVQDDGGIKHSVALPSVQSEEDTSDRIPKSNQLEKENEKDIFSLFSEESSDDNDLNNNSHWEEMESEDKSKDLVSMFSDDIFDDEEFDEQEEYGFSQYDKEEKIKYILDNIIKGIPHEHYNAYDSSEVINNYSISENQRRKIGELARGETIGIVDTTLSGKGGEGLLFTTEGIAFKYVNKKVFLRYTEIENITCEKNNSIILHGDFAGASVNEVPIKNIYYNLDELKMALELIVAIAKQSSLAENALQRLEVLYVYDEYAVTKHGFIMGKSLVNDFEDSLGVTAEEMDEEYAELMHYEIMDKLEKIKGIDRSHNAHYYNYYLKNCNSVLHLKDANGYSHTYVFDKNNKLIYINEYNCE